MCDNAQAFKFNYAVYVMIFPSSNMYGTVALFPLILYSLCIQGGINDLREISENSGRSYDFSVDFFLPIIDLKPDLSYSD